MEILKSPAYLIMLGIFLILASYAIASGQPESGDLLAPALSPILNKTSHYLQVTGFIFAGIGLILQFLKAK